ncbi:hypothetical protein [Niveispirillum lacus]|uniref:hypothetical protein n=1 Tax=Niveispirillum lacus TaxID=1981099 RepID=UPI0013FD95D0|nr:hypothetical protein [Niveispirillum lacus]
MPAFIHTAADDAHDVLSGLRTSLPTIADVIEAATLVLAAAFVAISLNTLF